MRELIGILVSLLSSFRFIVNANIPVSIRLLGSLPAGITYRLKMPVLSCVGTADLLDYSARRRGLYPLDPKPTCKNCEIHCYAPENRAKIREVMRFSGMRMIKRGRIDMIFHYFF